MEEKLYDAVKKFCEEHGPGHDPVLLLVARDVYEWAQFKAKLHEDTGPGVVLYFMGSIRLCLDNSLSPGEVIAS